MDREQEEAVQRITAQYVAEQRAGHHPRLGDYLSRYPLLADAITDFVTYYHAIEANIPKEIGVVSPLSQATRVALDEAWRRVLRPESVAPAVYSPLQKAANTAGKSFSQLAAEVGLSLDILKKLEQHIIDAATIPYEVLHRLVSALQQPLAAVEMYLGFAGRGQQVQGVAEASAPYRVDEKPIIMIQTQSFREAIEQSTELSDEQKDAWRSILEKEGCV
jgi:hypothetical protein